MPLGGLNVALFWNSPQQMFAGGWTTALLVDDRADAGQRACLEAIVYGRAGGPWAVLARFFEKRLDTHAVPIRLEDAGRTKRMWADGYFDTSIESLRGTDPAQEVRIANLFNQIHGPTHGIARGKTRCSDSWFPFGTEGTHALHSRFTWRRP